MTPNANAETHAAWAQPVDILVARVLMRYWLVSLTGWLGLCSQAAAVPLVFHKRNMFLFLQFPYFYILHLFFYSLVLALCVVKTLQCTVAPTARCSQTLSLQSRCLLYTLS